MDVNLLIECVRKHVYLYDLSHREYTNFALKARAWESIADEMEQTSAAVRHKWKTIKDGYMKYRKQLMKVSASKSFTKVAEYRWSRQLKFLDGHQVTRTSDTSPRASLNKAHPSSLNELLMTSFQTNSIYFKTIQQGGNSKAPANRLHAELNPQFPKEKNNEDPEDLEEPVNEISTPNHDAIDYLFLSYAQTFKKFPLWQQAVMKMELAKMFSRAELATSDFVSENPFSFVQVQSVTSIEDVDIKGSPTHWSATSSCSNSEQTIAQDNEFGEHIVP